MNAGAGASPPTDKAILVRRWLRERDQFGQKCLDLMFGSVALLRRRFHFDLGSIGGALASLARSLIFVAVAATPVWFKWFEGAPLKGTRAIEASALLVALLLLERLIAALRESSREQKARFQSASNFGQELSSLWSLFRKLPKSDAEERCQAILWAILGEAKLFLGEGNDSDLAANLWVFDNASGKMTLLKSTDRTRIGSKLPAPHMVANYICRRGTEYAVHDYRSFVKAKLAGKRCKFRSIFMMPLELHQPAVDVSSSVGMVSLTTTESYRFWPRTSYDNLRVTLSPQLSLLCGLLVNRHPDDSVVIVEEEW